MSAHPPLPTVGVVVLAWQDEPWLADCVTSILDSVGVHVELVVVDNGCRPADLAAAVALGPRLRVLSPGRNTGFAGGCHLGAAAHSAEYLALVNSDCVLRPDTLAQLVAEAARPGVGPVMASVRFAEPPHRVNSAGNPVHLVGLSWAGDLNTVETRTEPFDVTGASGACTLLSQAVWKGLDGFDEQYFAYLEDTELSLRAWRRGLTVRCVPTAIALHHYQFSRNAQKMYLLERNRLLMIGTLWSTRALWLLGPLLVGVELLLLGYAVATGWGRQKLRGWVWLWRHRQHVRERRRLLQSEPHVADAAWMAHLTPDLDPDVLGSARLVRMANVLFRGYWSVARRLLHR